MACKAITSALPGGLSRESRPGPPRGGRLGHVLQLEVVGGVAERPHPRDRRAVGVVGDHVAVGVEREAAGFGVEAVGVGLSAGRHQQRLRLERPRPSGRGDRDGHAVPPGRDRGDLAVEEDVEAVGGEFGDPGRHGFVFGHEQPG